MDLLILIAIVVQFIAILIICSRTAHISSISDTLSRIEKHLDSLAKQFVRHSSEESSQDDTSVQHLSDEELMEIYGITFENKKYHYQTYQYDRLQDAVSYARHSK